jgi:hypothetical protein
MKTKKPRTGKKRNMLKALQPSLENVVIYSAHCFDEMQVKGITSPAVHKAIFNQEHKWQIMLLTFCNDGVKQWADTFMPVMPVCKSDAAQYICDPISEKMISELNPKHFISSGWYCVLTDKIDLKAMEKDIINMFLEAGAADRQVCNLAWSLRPDSEK